jgi:hypothetical protein
MKAIHVTGTRTGIWSPCTYRLPTWQGGISQFIYNLNQNCLNRKNPKWNPFLIHIQNLKMSDILVCLLNALAIA